MASSYSSNSSSQRSKNLGFRYLDHITDVIIEAYGDTLEGAFENSAKGLVNTMFEISNMGKEQVNSSSVELKIEAIGYDYKSLLYDWLEKIMLIVLVDGIILSSFKIRILPYCSNLEKDNKNNEDYYCYSLIGTVKGEPMALGRHEYKIEVKGITYHEMEIKQENGGFVIRFLVDL